MPRRGLRRFQVRFNQTVDLLVECWRICQFMDMCGDIGTADKTMTFLILYALRSARCLTIKQAAVTENGVVKLTGLQPTFRQSFSRTA